MPFEWDAECDAPDEDFTIAARGLLRTTALSHTAAVIISDFAHSLV